MSGAGRLALIEKQDVSLCPWCGAAAILNAVMKQKGDYRRWLYRGGRPNWFARFQNRATAVAFAAGIMPRRAAVLRIRGRRTGRVITFPVAIADYAGERYLVSMLGEDVNWVRNLRAADGHAVLKHGRREAVRLEEVDIPDRAPILRRYVQVAPGARPHIPAGPQAPLADFERISPDYPVFRIRADAALPAIRRRAMLPNRHCRHGSGSERDARVDG